MKRIDRAYQAWYGRAVIGFILGLVVAIGVAVIQINLWPESHEYWLRNGDYIVMPLGGAILHVYPFTPRAINSVFAPVGEFFARLRGSFRQARRRRRR